mgnify:CR=1 FL=1
MIGEYLNTSAICQSISHNQWGEEIITETPIRCFYCANDTRHITADGAEVVSAASILTENAVEMKSRIIIDGITYKILSIRKEKTFSSQSPFYRIFIA